jgi:PAS domain S-box-containing protein/putative nucleotidyltransferase with HDIG domain
MTRILGVDDNSADRSLLETILNGNGYETQVAENGAVALQAAVESPPALVITDALMPVMDGFELCRRWLAEPALRHIPIIFYTSEFADPESEELALALGAARYLTKPMHPKDLLREIKKVLEEASLRPVPAGDDSPESKKDVLHRHHEAVIQRLEQSQAALVKEIAEHKQLENELLDNNERFQLITSASPDALIVTRLSDGLISYVNEQCAQLIGVNASELVGQCTPDFYVHPADRQTFMSMLKDSVVVQNWEVMLKRGDGTSFPALVNARVGSFMGQESIYAGIRDITERKLSEEQIQRMSQIADLAPGGIVVHDCDGNFLYANQNALQLHGYTKDEFMSLNLLQINAPESAEQVALRMEILDKVGEVDFEVRSLRKDGTTFPEQVYAKRIEWSGKPAMISVFNDITERKQAEEALTTQRQTYELILEQSLAGYWDWDIPTGYEYMSSTFKKMFGYEDHEIENRAESWQRLIFAEDLPGVFEKFNQHVESKGKTPFYNEVRYHHKNGSTVWVICTGKVIEWNDDGKAKRMIGCHIDITERKQAEEALLESTKQTQRILDNLQDAYFQADLKGNFTLVNPRALSMYGYQFTGELLGQPAVKLYANPEERLKILEELKSNKVLTDYTCQGLRKDGSAFWVSMNVQFLHDEQGNIIGTEGLVRDISERIKMEDEIAAKSEDLQITNVKLEHMLQQAVYAISRIGELRDAYTAGHQRQVRDLACKIAESMGLSDEVVRNISYAALIHDIGKIYIASDILNKPGNITNLEYQILQTHAEHGYNVIREVDFPEAIPTMVYQHHERLDGSGYPQGLSGDEITIESRILAVADVVEAMTSHRPYRPALGVEAALAEIQQHKGTKYDPKVVEVCISLFKDQGFKFES